MTVVDGLIIGAAFFVALPATLVLWCAFGKEDPYLWNP